MLAIQSCRSDLTDKDQLATICPTLISEVDGRTICEGIADCDMLDLFEFGVYADGTVLPLALMSHVRSFICGRIMVTVVRKPPQRLKNNPRRSILRAWAKKEVEEQKLRDRETAYLAHKARIQAEEHRWHDVPNDDIDETAALLMGLIAG